MNNEKLNHAESSNYKQSINAENKENKLDSRPELLIQNNIVDRNRIDKTKIIQIYKIIQIKNYYQKDNLKKEKKELLDDCSYDDKTFDKIAKFINGNLIDINNIYKKLKYYDNKIFINKNILLKEIYIDISTNGNYYSYYKYGNENLNLIIRNNLYNYIINNNYK